MGRPMTRNQIYKYVKHKPKRRPKRFRLESLLRKANAFIDCDKLSRAMDIIETALSMQPHNPYVLGLKIKCLRKMNRLSEAECTAWKNFDYTPNAINLDLLIKILTKQRKFKQAQEILMANLEIVRTDMTLYSRLISNMIKQGQFEKVLPFAKDYYEKHKDGRSIHLLISALVFNEKYEEAKTLIKRHEDILGINATGVLIEILRKQRYYNAALHLFEKTENPNFQIYINVAYIYMSIKEFHLAYKYLRIAQDYKYNENQEPREIEIRTYCGYIFLLRFIMINNQQPEFLDDLTKKAKKAATILDSLSDVLPSQKKDYESAMQIIEERNLLTI